VNRGGAARGLAAGSFDDVHGASFRGAYDLSDLDRSRFVVAPGQSGNPVSRHARDFLERWRDGGTIALTAQPDHIAATLELLPEHRP
jgi:penicillin amidase